MPRPKLVKTPGYAKKALLPSFKGLASANGDWWHPEVPTGDMVPRNVWHPIAKWVAETLDWDLPGSKTMCYSSSCCEQPYKGQRF